MGAKLQYLFRKAGAEVQCLSSGDCDERGLSRFKTASLVPLLHGLWSQLLVCVEALRAGESVIWVQWFVLLQGPSPPPSMCCLAPLRPWPGTLCPHTPASCACQTSHSKSLPWVTGWKSLPAASYWSMLRLLNSLLVHLHSIGWLQVTGSVLGKVCPLSCWRPAFAVIRILGRDFGMASWVVTVVPAGCSKMGGAYRGGRGLQSRCYTPVYLMFTKRSGVLCSYMVKVMNCEDEG